MLCGSSSQYLLPWLTMIPNFEGLMMLRYVARVVTFLLVC